MAQALKQWKRGTGGHLHGSTRVRARGVRTIPWKPDCTLSSRKLKFAQHPKMLATVPTSVAAPQHTLLSLIPVSSLRLQHQREKEGFVNREREARLWLGVTIPMGSAQQRRPWPQEGDALHSSLFPPKLSRHRRLLVILQESC